MYVYYNAVVSSGSSSRKIFMEVIFENFENPFENKVFKDVDRFSHYQTWITTWLVIFEYIFLKCIR